MSYMTRSPENENRDDLSAPDMPESPDIPVVGETSEFPADTGSELSDPADLESREIEPAESPESTGADDGDSDATAGSAAPVATGSTESHKVAGSMAGSTWVGLIIGAVILILLLVFILQNLDSVRLSLFAWEWNFPIGVGMLIAAIGGALVMGCVGGVRMLQLRRQISHPGNTSGSSRKGLKGRKDKR